MGTLSLSGGALTEKNDAGILHFLLKQGGRTEKAVLTELFFTFFDF